nr:AzlC family ABC transporter permease [Tianweitania aestuarii]
MNEAQDEPSFRWYLRGARAAYSIPGFILMSSFVGFSALAKAADVGLWATVFMTGIVWALPAQVVLVGAVIAGNSLGAAALAVALSSVRLTPMVVAIVPELRGPRTRGITLYFLSHFVAVTSWVLAMAKLPDVPASRRTAFYFGLGSTLTLTNMIVVGCVYVLVDALPRELSAALFMLTPMYFLTSLWGSAREWATNLAMVFGIVLGPVCHVLVPSFDLLIAGFAGGIGAYVIYRLAHRRRSA